MAYRQDFDSLHLCTLDPEWNRRTCNYWYTVTTYGATSHTAFRTRAALLRWLEERGLKLTQDLPQHGEHSHQRLVGRYARVSHMSYDEFYALKGDETRVLDNADYTLGIITTDEDGTRVVHHLNCNLKHRPVFDYRETSAKFS